MKKRTLSQTPKKPTLPPPPPEQKSIEHCQIPIVNRLKPYCTNCPNIEPITNTRKFYANGKAALLCGIIIDCQYAKQCETIKEYLERALGQKKV